MAAPCDYRSVQGLIHIGPRHRDEVFDPARHGTPGVMNHAESGVTVFHAIGNDSQCEQIEHLIGRDALLLKLQMDGIKALQARLRNTRYVVLLQFGFDDLSNFSKEGFM